MSLEETGDDERPQLGEESGVQGALRAAAPVTMLDFLRHVGVDKGHPCIAWPRRSGKRHWFDHYSCDTIEQAVAKATELAPTEDVYFSPFALKKKRVWDNTKPNGGGWAYRTHANMLACRCLFIDLDCGTDKNGKPKDYPNQPAAWAALRAFGKATGLPRPTAVSSGYGLHVYFTFDHALPAASWKKLAAAFAELIKAHGFKVDQSRLTDISSVLRVPGTCNHKDPLNPQPVTVLAGCLAPPTPVEELTVLIETALRIATRNGGADQRNDDARCDRVSDDFSNAAGERQGRPAPAETPENVATVGAMLAMLDPDMDRNTWRNVLWGVLGTRWGRTAEQLVHDWSMKGAKWDDGAFDKVIASFDPNHLSGIGFGTFVHLAREAGYNGVLPDTGGGSARNGAESEAAGGSLINGMPSAAIDEGGDKATGRLFARMHFDTLRYVPEWRSWIAFDPAVGWKKASFEAERGAKAVSDAMYADAIVTIRQGGLDQEARRRLRVFVERASRLPQQIAMIEMAKSEPGMSIGAVDLDADRMRLGVLNGELDLTTQRPTPVTPASRVTLRCSVAYDPAATCPLWKRFVERIFPDPEKRAFAQRLAGLFLTGLTREQQFVFAQGGGLNGKSTFFEVVAFVLGDYAVKLPTEVLMQQRYAASPSAASPEVVALKGARLAYTGETEDGQRLATARIKGWTGEDMLTGRQLYKDPIRFLPTHKLVIVGNPKIAISDSSHAMARRFIFFSFDVTISEGEKVKDLPLQLKSEGAGILNWMLEGLCDYLAGDGLRVPPIMQAAARAYLQAEDILGTFLDEACDTGQSFSVTKSALRQVYEQWCTENGHLPMSQTRLTKELAERGIALDGGRRTFNGASLKSRPFP